jgi:hypothetical protein
MRLKWLELAWYKKPASLHASDHENRTDKDKDKSDKENPMAPINQPSEKASAPSARAVPTFQVELLPMEDIYRIAGIMTPRKGYTINKVIDMLHSEHIRGLSPEMKRSAVLMALDAGGIPLDQLNRDAEARRQALDSYEAEQNKNLDAEWARKAQEVLEIQAELESLKAHFMARISRNLEGVAREKAAFAAWLGLKQEECQKMADAVEQCLKSPVVEPVSAPPADASPAKASAKAV